MLRRLFRRRPRQGSGWWIGLGLGALTGVLLSLIAELVGLTPWLAVPILALSGWFGSTERIRSSCPI